ncbi:thioredoxin family protein [Roseicyclus persicicus]|uniref:Thioredoxin n=1 Tax=Roseicyclus persicicus TaxID=2650661 RepID=A0A7X6GYD1_9RHOB|nr:thioredoxin domain-containing protein [Roseibacterium persicicum]NKX44641.1 thioredoxin fold domain-containing protein [Roseibacterium persicicum]
MPLSSVTDASFANDVLQADGPVLVVFSATWCAPCHQMTAVLDELSVELAGRIRILKIDVEESPGQAARFGVRGMPGLFILHGGTVVAQRSGAAPRATARRWILETLEGLAPSPC